MIYCGSGSYFGKVSVLVPFLIRQKVEIPAFRFRFPQQCFEDAQALDVRKVFILPILHYQIRETGIKKYELFQF
jgi:hypothetical protein